LRRSNCLKATGGLWLFKFDLFDGTKHLWDMETFKTVIGSAKVNRYLKLGWKRVHVFSKPIAWSDDGNVMTECDVAFVIVWDSSTQGETPLDPNKQTDAEPE
jgi:hypothetical protein